jgi:hypothetical protein
MAVVAGVVFFAIRALLALFPVLTVAFPIKKWAAAGALAAAAFYLLLSGVIMPRRFVSLGGGNVRKIVANSRDVVDVHQISRFSSRRPQCGSLRYRD